MEKLICSACGAPLTPDTTSPFLTCEYCDTNIENKFYVEPAVKEPEPAAEVIEPETSVFEADTAEAEEETASDGSLLKSLLGVGTAIAASNLRRRSTVVQRPVIRTSSFDHAPARHNHQRVIHSTPHRHPEPLRTGSTGMRPARPGMGGPGGRGPGGRGPGGRGGMGRPGGR